MALSTNITAGQAGHAGLHNTERGAINDIAARFGVDGKLLASALPDSGVIDETELTTALGDAGLSDEQATAVAAAIAAIPAPAWTAITGKPAAFTPAVHAATHATGGSDVLTPAAIGAGQVAGGNTWTGTQDFTGATVTGLSAFAPPLVTGEWSFGYPHLTADIRLFTTDGDAHFTPFFVPKNAHVTDFAVEVTAAGSTGRFARLGVLAASATTGRPATLVADLGTVDVSTTGAKTVSPVGGLDLTPGWYWFAAHDEGAGTTRATLRAANPNIGPLIALGASALATTQRHSYSGTVTGAYASNPTVTPSAANCPRFMWRVTG